MTIKQDGIALIGAGQMGTALARGLVNADFCTADQIRAYDPMAAAIERFLASVPGATVQTSSMQAVAEADIVLLAVKPHQMAAVASEIRPAIAARHLLVSVAAGVSLAQLCEWTGNSRVVRVMPNTPCLVGKGVSAFACGPAASTADAERVRSMMESVGIALAVDEPLLDAVTGLSGSGPAYVYLLIEALADGGVRVGLSRESALRMAAHTVRGAAEMVISSQEHPAVLKDRVASPGGTTITGLQVLEERGVRAAAMAAVEAATRRAREMGKSER